MKLLKSILSVTALCIPLLWASSSLAATCTSGSTCVTVGNGENALTKEQARQEQQQWDETKQLRSKVNQRSAKEFDKLDKAIDEQDACQKSLNLSAYWEPNTERCLDANTGRPIRP
nr:DUF1283 family protein [uncultured Moellerella sp.]